MKRRRRSPLTPCSSLITAVKPTFAFPNLRSTAAASAGVAIVTTATTYSDLQFGKRTLTTFTVPNSEQCEAMAFRKSGSAKLAIFRVNIALLLDSGVRLGKRHRDRKSTRLNSSHA